jgi:hypothetical protein
MKVAFLVYTEVYTPRVMTLLTDLKIDYYTRWSEVTGKGHGTEPHLGTRSFPGVNSVLMIAFEHEEPLSGLISAVTTLNAGIPRPDDHVRVFQLPLERII